VDVVFEGALSHSWGMADVLRELMGVENQAFGILRISSPGSNVSGRLVIADSAFIVGAVVSDGSETGYLAVRRLLLAADGNFAYLDTAGKRPQDLDQELYISIQRLAEIWPQLPHVAEQVFDEKALLDKVFGNKGTMPPDPISGHIPIIAGNRQLVEQSIPEGSAIKSLQPLSSATGSAAGQRQPWKTVVQPLLSNSLIDGAKEPSGRLYGDLDDTATHRQSLTKMREQRALADRPSIKQFFPAALISKRAIIWIALIGLLLATIAMIAAVNQPNSLTIHKRSSNDLNPKRPKRKISHANLRKQNGSWVTERQNQDSHHRY